jgi:hypothetical protein
MWLEGTSTFSTRGPGGLTLHCQATTPSLFE